MIIYRPGDDPRVMLDATIRSDPGLNYMLVPVGMGWLVGLTEHQEQRPIEWSLPAGECELV